MRDFVRGSPFAQALDDRNSASHSRLIFKGDIRSLGGLCQFDAMMRNHRLVSGDKSLAGGNACPGERERRAIRSTDQFDNNVDILTARKRDRIVAPCKTGEIDPPFAVPVDLPETERAAQECLSLPVHPSLSQGDLERIVTAVNALAKAGA